MYNESGLVPAETFDQPKQKLWNISAVMILLIILAYYCNASVASTDSETTGCYTKTNVSYKNNQAITCPGEKETWQTGYHECFRENNEPIRVHLTEVDFIVNSEQDRDHLEKARYTATSMQVLIAGTQIPCRESESTDCSIKVCSINQDRVHVDDERVRTQLPKTYIAWIVTGVLTLGGGGGYIAWS